jgi:hypothetical protein
MHSLDLGRTDWDHQSLREFKLSWGAEERTLEYRHLGAGQDRVDGSRIARRAGPVIRHSPAFVGRLVGEALYRVSA